MATTGSHWPRPAPTPHQNTTPARPSREWRNCVAAGHPARGSRNRWRRPLNGSKICSFGDKPVRHRREPGATWDSPSGAGGALSNATCVRSPQSPHKMRPRRVWCWQCESESRYGTQTTPRGFEPLRAEPNGFRVHLLSRSDTVSGASCGSARTHRRPQLPQMRRPCAGFARSRYRRTGGDLKDSCSAYFPRPIRSACPPPPPGLPCLAPILY